MPKGKGRHRRLASVIGELEFEAAPDTTKDEKRHCRHCELELPHHFEAGLWVAIRHDAPCGLPCLGGSVNAATRDFHSDQCPRCR